MTPVPREIVDLINKSDHFIGHVHVRPDADSVGSMLALKLGLNQIGKKLELYCEDSFPNSFKFLPAIDQIEKINLKGITTTAESVYLFVDTANWKIATHEDVIPTYPRQIINIDHHPDNNVVATFSWIDGTASSSCEMIFELLKKLGVEITSDIATCLIAGLLSDTYSFKNQNTNERCFLMAAELYSLGAEYQKCILNLVRSKSIDSFIVLGFVANNLKLSADSKFVWISISYEDWQKIGNGSIGEIANEILSSVEGTLFGAILAEKEPGITKGSMRSRDLSFDVSKIAHLLGGGGHKAAAGIKIDKPIDKAEADFLAAVKKAGYN